jgi:hypothetical protein
MKIDALVGPATSLQEICSHEGGDFIRCAYLTVLGRLPDEEGFGFYLARLDQGVSKLTILYQLRNSQEARGHDPGIAGLDRALKKHRRGTLPIIGWIYRILISGESEALAARDRRALLRRIERLEARLLAVHADLADRIDGQAFGPGLRRKFGIVPANEQSAQPWSVNDSA